MITVISTGFWTRPRAPDVDPADKDCSGISRTDNLNAMTTVFHTAPEPSLAAAPRESVEGDLHVFYAARGSRRRPRRLPGRAQAQAFQTPQKDRSAYLRSQANDMNCRADRRIFALWKLGVFILSPVPRR
jgi:hypothetical protein